LKENKKVRKKIEPRKEKGWRGGGWDREKPNWLEKKRRKEQKQGILSALISFWFPPLDREHQSEELPELWKELKEERRMLWWVPLRI